MKSSIYAAVLSAGIVAAQVGIECTGYNYPNYDDCDSVIDFFNFRNMAESDVVAFNGEDGPEPSCTWWYWNDGNCRISNCWTVTNDYMGSRGEVTGPNIARGYDGIKSTCQGFRAGGKWPSALDENGNSRSYQSVYNDPDQSPPSSKRRRSMSADGFVKETVSLEEHEAWVNRVTAKVTSASEMMKRADDDTGYQIVNSAIGVRDASIYETGPRLSNGVGYTYEVSESTSYTTTSSVNVGAAFEIFSAGVSYEYSETESFTVTEGLTFDVNCAAGQTGQVFMYPLFDYYDVGFTPSGERSEIWLPVTTDKKINGEIEIQCIG